VRVSDPSPKSPWRSFAVVALCAILPLALFLVIGDHLVRRMEVNNITQLSGPTADLAGKIIEEKLLETRTSLQALASDRSLVELWAHHDTARMHARLRAAHELKPEVAVWAIYDSKGTVVAAYPEDFGSGTEPPEWLGRLLRDRTAYISGARPLPGHADAVVTIAAPLDCDGCATLAASYTPATVKGWLSGMAISAAKWLSVVDQNGIVVMAPGLNPSLLLQDLSAQDDVRLVLAGRDGTAFLSQNGQSRLVSRRPIPSIGWGVLLQVPGDEIDKAIWKVERPLGIAGLLLVLLAFAIGGAGASLFRRLKESREHIQQIVETSHDAFVGMNERGAITEWNSQAEKLFGYAAGEAIGRQLHTTIIPEGHRKAHCSGLEHFLRTGEGPVLNRRLEMAAMHRDGHEFPVELSISHMRSRGRSSFNAFIHDISNRKHAEEEIAGLNQELRGQVAELAERNKELEAFSASVSHDVRAPLRHISGFAQLLSEEFGAGIKPAVSKYLDEIRNGARRMHKLVEDLLRFSQLGVKALQFHPVVLNDLVDEVVLDLKRDLEARKVRFDRSELPVVRCDRALMKQVFWNLLSNAVKFSSIRDEAVIEIGQTAGKHGAVVFIRDNGAGFDMKYADKLFSPFQRLHSEEEFEGAGVGLATVQRIIARHSGRIWAQGEPGSGATFFIQFGDSHVGRDPDFHAQVEKTAGA
jgi:PAS domain S-box-containing protein